MSAVCRFKVPKPVVELYGKCEKEQKADVARAVIRATARIEQDFRAAIRGHQVDRAWGMWNRAVQKAWESTLLKAEEDPQAYLGRGKAVRQNGPTNSPDPYKGEQAMQQAAYNA
eukprot:6986165-Alexandrium_andersonii.AAC.1